MTKKTITEAGKKEAILETALESFLENGYESTSVRSISQKVGCEVGLIYYYFKTKEELFDKVLDAYYEKTEKEMQAITAQSDANVEKFIDYMEKKAISYRKNFSDNVHFSIRASVREKIASLSEAYLTEILKKSNQHNAKNIASFLSGGLCATILHDDAEYYTENKESILKIVRSLTGKEIKEPIVQKESKPTPQKKEIPSFLL